ncbi:MAG: LytTR family DNA-binding domain-containing protein [Bacteroidota bacterium]
MNVLILEDEFPAANKLVHYLSDFFDSEFTYTHLRSVREGVETLKKTSTFDLILSDIKLLDGTSFEVFDTVPLSILIIFCTAYEEHLLEAFKTNGIAYILKPFSREEIKTAITKYKTLFSTEPIEKTILKEFQVLFEEERRSYKKRFAIKRKSGIKFLETKEISYIEAFGDFCKLTDANGQFHVTSQNIGSLIMDLDPSIFFKVNRSQIVNIEYIEKIDAYSKNRLSIKMAGQQATVLTSSATTKDFRKWLEK